MTFRWMRAARELFERWRDVAGFGAAAGPVGIDERMAFEIIAEERLKAEDEDGG